MSDVEAKSERGKSADLRIVSSAQSAARAIHRTRIRIIPVLITLATTALAVGLGWAMWNAYMGEALDARRHRARLYRHDGPGGRRPHRRATGHRQ